MNRWRLAVCALSLLAGVAHAGTVLEQAPLHQFGMLAGGDHASFRHAEGVAEGDYAERLTFSLAQEGDIVLMASWYSSFRLSIHPPVLQLFDADGILVAEGESLGPSLPSCGSPEHPGSSECWGWDRYKLSTHLAAGDYSLALGGRLNDAHEYPTVTYSVAVAIPEPSTVALMLLGCAGLSIARCRREKGQA